MYFKRNNGSNLEACLAPLYCDVSKKWFGAQTEKNNFRDVTDLLFSRTAGFFSSSMNQSFELALKKKKKPQRREEEVREIGRKKRSMRVNIWKEKRRKNNERGCQL